MKPGFELVYQTDILYTQANNRGTVTNTRIAKDTDLPPRHLAPLERSELRPERVRVASQTRLPIVLLLVAGGAIAAFAFKVPPGYILIAIVLILAIRWYIRYQSGSPKRRKEMAEELITRENQSENDQIVTEMRALTAEGFDGYAITLGKFLQHKRQIEAELEKREGESPQQTQVAQLVDSICFGVAEQFHSIAAIEKRLGVLQDSRGGEEYEALSERAFVNLGRYALTHSLSQAEQEELIGFNLAFLESRLSRLPVFQVHALDEKQRATALQLRARHRRPGEGLESESWESTGDSALSACTGAAAVGSGSPPSTSSLAPGSSALVSVAPRVSALGS